MDLRQHCHWQGDDRPWMERALDSVTDDQIEMRSAKCFAATLSLRPGTLILVMGPFAMADVQATEKTPYAERRALA
jgi:hypothetical protein